MRVFADCIYRAACHKAFATKQKAIIIGSLGNSCRCRWCCVYVYVYRMWWLRSDLEYCTNFMLIMSLNKRSFHFDRLSLSLSISLHVQLFLALWSIYNRIIECKEVKTNNCMPVFSFGIWMMRGCVKSVSSTRNTYMRCCCCCCTIKCARIFLRLLSTN